ncbi:hypothetical protein CW358_06480 [Pseudomonas protegens]|nr:hypothetical protein CW358_06480 [Pseudomonas protegens]
MHRPGERLRWQASSCGRPGTARYFRRSRLAGEAAISSCIALVSAFAGKPARTAALALHDIFVGAGLPAKRPSGLASPRRAPSLASQLLRSRGAWWGQFLNRSVVSRGSTRRY